MLTTISSRDDFRQNNPHRAPIISSQRIRMEYRFRDDVRIPVGDVVLEGSLVIPLDAQAIIVFSHGSGSSRFSPRNTKVASMLQKQHFGVLLFDLLTAVEDRHYENRFDIERLTDRLEIVTRWLEGQDVARGCSIAFFGASTGAASALRTAARVPEVAAVVCRGGRVDLAMEQLPDVHCPVLLIVGSRDEEVLEWNRTALKALHNPKKLAIIEGATHLFEEPGCMEQVSHVAADWFGSHIPPIHTY